jgi:hypothetical protein
MSHLRLLLCRVEDDESGSMTQLAAVDLPATQLNELQATTCLDVLEERTLQAGQALMVPLLEAQWSEVDALLTQQARQAFSPSAQGRARTTQSSEPTGHPAPQAPGAGRQGKRHSPDPG